MSNDYSSWSVDKLNKEIQKIQKFIKTKESRDKKAALAKLESIARKSGFELYDLVGTGNPRKTSVSAVSASAKQPKKTKKRGKVAPKYRNPANDSETWTGRGRQPLWVKNFVEGGGALADVTIDDVISNN